MAVDSPRMILQEKITELRERLRLNQWKSTNEVLEWFSTLKFTKAASRNQKTKFIKFDIEAYYPSITRDLLNKSIQFAKECGVFICETDISIVMQARESFL